MTEIIEGEAVEITPERAVAVAPQAHVLSGVGAVASIDDDTFAKNLALIRKGVERARMMQTALLDKGTDYGVVPNVPRPFLHKPGAEKLEKAYGLATEFSIERLVGDGVASAPLSFLARAYVHLGDHSGPIVGEGVGEANSWETRYRYRKAERTCPLCGAAAVIKGKAEYGGGWVCFKKKDGCGAKFSDNAPEIIDQPSGNVDNPDPWDLANTLVKMAKKRAYVDAILTATATSGLFTQDDDSPVVPQPHDDSSGRHSSPAATPAPAVAPSGGGGYTSTGVVEFAKAPADGSLREGPDGWAFGFVLLEPNTRNPEGKPYRLHVLATDALATMAAGALEAGSTVTVTGELTRVPFDNDASKSYRRVIASRIETPEWTLPGDVVAPAPLPANVSVDDDIDGLAW